MPVGASIGAIGGSLASGAIQAGAAGDAANAAENATQQNLAFTKQVYGNTSNNLQPTINQGQTSGTALAGLLGVGGNPQAAQTAFQNYLGSTNYNFVKNQGDQGIEYSNAPALKSSGTAKALDQYNTGLAGNALSGYEGLLAGQQSLGANSAVALGQIGTNTTQQAGSWNNNMASAQGSAALTEGNASVNALNGIGQGATALGNTSFGQGIMSAVSGLV